MDKLKPCPLCGSEMPEYRINCHRDVKRGSNGLLVMGSRWDDYLVVCPKCGARTQICDTEEDAVNLWNSRA